MIKVKTKLIPLFIIFLIAISRCDYYCKSFQGEEKLGNNFKLINESKDNIYVLYCTSKTSCCNVGFDVIPSKIININFNDEWIIAESLANESISYWIVKKKNFRFDPTVCKTTDCTKLLTKATYGPFSVSQFRRNIDSLKIELTFR